MSSRSYKITLVFVIGLLLAVGAGWVGAFLSSRRLEFAERSTKPDVEADVRHEGKTVERESSASLRQVANVAHADKTEGTRLEAALKAPLNEAVIDEDLAESMAMKVEAGSELAIGIRQDWADEKPNVQWTDQLKKVIKEIGSNAELLSDFSLQHISCRQTTCRMHIQFSDEVDASQFDKLLSAAGRWEYSSHSMDPDYDGNGFDRSEGSREILLRRPAEPDKESAEAADTIGDSRGPYLEDYGAGATFAELAEKGPP
jgi:hypothetical protein